MLSAEAEERAKKRWMDMFDKVYPKCESMFRADSTLLISRVDDLKTYGEDGLEYTLQVAPWEKEDEDEEHRVYIKVYADSEPSEKAEKVYQITQPQELKEVAECLMEYAESEDK